MVFESLFADRRKKGGQPNVTSQERFSLMNARAAAKRCYKAYIPHSSQSM
jgi:hypothetical protein